MEIDTNILIYQDAEETYLQLHSRARTAYEGILARYYQVAEAVGRFHGLQRSEGRYPEGLKEDELVKAANDPSRQPEARTLLDPYTLVQREGGLLVARNYRDVPKFRKTMDDVATSLSLTSKYIQRVGDKLKNPREVDLMTYNLFILRPAFNRGYFRYSRMGLLHMSELPELMMDMGLADRYDDEFGLKLSAEGWIAARDDEGTKKLNNIIQLAQSGFGSSVENGKTNPRFRIFYGNVIAYTGLARFMEYRGNTLPSEDDLRENEGAMGYIFGNRLEVKVKEVLAPRYSDYMQGEPLSYGELLEAVLYVIAGHEGVGHSNVDVGNAELIRAHYTTLKEAGSELIGQAAIHKVAKTINRRLARNAILASLDWLRADIDDYRKEKDPDKKKTLLPYARAAAMILNYHLHFQSIELDEAGKIKLLEEERFETNAWLMAKRITEVTHHEGTDLGGTDRLVHLWIESPTNYLGSNGTFPGDCPPAQVLAA